MNDMNSTLLEEMELKAFELKIEFTHDNMWGTWSYRYGDDSDVPSSSWYPGFATRHEALVDSLL